MLFGSDGNSYTVCVQSDMCVYTCCAQYGDGGREKEIKNIGIAVKAACRGNLSSCHFGRACNRFDTPGPQTIANCTQQGQGKRNRVAKICFALRPSYHTLALVLPENHVQLLLFLEGNASHLSTGTGYPSSRLNATSIHPYPANVENMVSSY